MGYLCRRKASKSDGISLFMDTGREAALEWNTSEISASTSVFDITQNQSEELNYTVMSEIAFGSNLDIASGSTVPTQESIIADTIAAWEHEEFVPKNTTITGKLAKDNRSKSRGNKRKKRESNLPNESSLSEASESSINYSAIQSAVLLPNVNQLFSSQAESNSNHQAPNSCTINPILKNETSIINQTSVNKLPHLNNPRETEKEYQSQSSLNSSKSGDNSCNSEIQLNSTYLTSQNSSIASDCSSNQTVAEIDRQLKNTKPTGRKKKAGNTTLPTLPEEGNKKILNVPPKEVVKKKTAKGATNTKTKGTQVNLKTKAPKKNGDTKKTIVRKNKEKKQENNKQVEVSIRENIPQNDLNVNLGDPSNPEIKSKEVLLKEKVEELLNMPGTSHAVPDINDTIETVNQTISIVDPDQSRSEILVSQSCSIEIVKEANRASKINIILPPETSLSFSKTNPASTKARKSLPTNKVKNDSLAAGNDTPKLEKIKVKQEKFSPKSFDLTSGSGKMNGEKEDTKDKKRHSRKSEASRPENKKHEKASPVHKPKRHTIACGYMSSDSSDESDGSYESSEGSTSCSCSDCASYCSCSFCDGSSSCSCSCCSDSSYESPPRRRRHR